MEKVIAAAKKARCHDFIMSLPEGYDTIIMIAHRLKTVRHADQILVVADGKIVQKGIHEELLNKPGIYKNFVSERQEAVSWKIA